jgi:putative ABC transport system permease protein
VRRGRPITLADTESAAHVAVISDEAARRFFPGEDPLGRRLRIHVSLGAREREREIVGIVGDVKIGSIESAAPPVAYVPHAQYASDEMTVFVRAAANPMALLPVVKSQLASIDREIALTAVRPGDQIVAAAVAQPRFRMLLLALFAGMALGLATVGLYGVMAYSVSQRQNELGLRMALGAEPGDLLRLVMRDGLIPVAVGIAVGLAGAAMLTQLMSTLLFGIVPFDPITFSTVSLLLGVVAALACYIPARRAATADPATALRTL